MKTNFYVDAFNLYYGCLKGTRDRWLNLDALFRVVFPKNEINRIRYFTAIVEARPPNLRQAGTPAGLPSRPTNHPEPFDPLRPVQDTRGLPLAKPPASGPKIAHVLRTEEKGSDVNLASHLLLDAFRGDCETAIVVSNDADLKAPIEIAKDELGISVGVLNPHPLKRRSLDLQPTFFKQLRRGPITASQFPPVLRDAHGEIRKPPSW